MSLGLPGLLDASFLNLSVSGRNEQGELVGKHNGFGTYADAVLAKHPNLDQSLKNAVRSGKMEIFKYNSDTQALYDLQRTYNEILNKTNKPDEVAKHAPPQAAPQAPNPQMPKIEEKLLSPGNLNTFIETSFTQPKSAQEVYKAINKYFLTNTDENKNDIINGLIAMIPKGINPTDMTPDEEFSAMQVAHIMGQLRFTNPSLYGQIRFKLEPHCEHNCTQVNTNSECGSFSRTSSITLSTRSSMQSPNGDNGDNGANGTTRAKGGTRGIRIKRSH